MISSINSNVFVPLSSPRQNTVEPLLSITVTPDSSNVTSGDKSANSATVNITTPGKEAEATVTRETAVNRLENKLLKNTLNNAIGSQKSTFGAVKTLLAAEALSNSGASQGDARETAVDLYATKQAYNLAQFALNKFSANSPEASSHTRSSTSNESQNQFVALSTQAMNYHIKSTLFFSATDSIGQKIDEFS